MLERFAIIFPFDTFGGIDIAFIFDEHQPFLFPFFQEDFSFTWSNTLFHRRHKLVCWRDIAINLILNCEACLSVQIPLQKILHWQLNAAH
jgi:hypothetical protein